MIKINVPKDKMNTIEKKHWEWFEKTGKNKLKNYLDQRTYIITKNNKKEENKITKDIYKLLQFLNEKNRLESIVIGNLIMKKDEFDSIDNTIEEIKYKFPILFESLLKSSIKDFLKQIRIQLETIRNENKTDITSIKTLMKNYFENEKEVISDHYDEIMNLIDELKISGRRIYKLSKIEDIFKNETNKELKIILSNIFNYNKFTRGDEIVFENKAIRWGAYELLNELKIITCPYCNRQYIHTYTGENGKSRADIDHFYPKSKYPFLAVSLYNLIPSCHICNSSFKGNIDFYKNKCIYPYEEEFGQYAKFETKFYKDKNKKTYDISYLLGNSDNFEIELSISKDKIDNSIIHKIEKQNKKINLDIEYNNYIQKINNSIKIFCLNDLYNLHKDYVKELIKIAIIYNESIIDEFFREYPELFSSRNEVMQLIVSNYMNYEDLGKRPLSKLTKDICEELGLI